MTWGRTVALWLCITSPGNWQHVKRIGRWAVSSRHRALLERVSIGDRCIVYLTKDATKSGGVLEAAIRLDSRPLTQPSSTEPTLFDRMYPVQVEISVEVEARFPVQFGPLAGQLSFIRKPLKWGSYLQGLPMRRLTEPDYKTLRSAMEATSS